MKFYLAMFLCFGTNAVVGAMNYDNTYMKFKLDNDLRVIGSKAKNMDFLVPPSEFTGKIITEIVPLHETDIKALLKGFEAARKDKEIKEVAYELEDIYFLAAIKYKNDHFFVKVKYLVFNLQADK